MQFVIPGIPCSTVQTTDGGCCVFPFVYNSKPVNGCTTEDSPLNYWCGKTDNYDRDKDWGYCLCELLVKFCAFFLFTSDGLILNGHSNINLSRFESR